MKKYEILRGGRLKYLPIEELLEEQSSSIDNDSDSFTITIGLRKVTYYDNSNCCCKLETKTQEEY